MCSVIQVKTMNLFIWLCTIPLLGCYAGPLTSKHYLELPSVDRFREYLRIDTSKEENLKYAVEFWIRQSKVLGLPYAVFVPAGKPIFVMTLEGSDPSLPSIMLNSHMDVVKVDENEWSHPPFDAFMDENGDIYGRGAQDTKDVGIQYLEAIRRIKKNNITLARTVHLTAMPDEETGGKNGMKAFVKTKEFKTLNIGFALDEGLPTSDDTHLALFVDKRAWQMEFLIRGVGGHGSFMPEGSAMDNAHKFINAVMAYRETQKKILRSNTTSGAAGYTSLNINVIQAGMAVNIIPSSVKIMVDMRLATDADPELMQFVINQWMKEAGNSTEVTFLRRETKSGITSVDETNPYWVTMRDTLTKIGAKFRPIVLPATSDMLVLRNMGIPAIGFTTKINTISRLHAKDEYQNVKTFLKGIDVYTELIKNLGNIPSVKKDPKNKKKCQH
ncbi:hypothetical protein PYW07_002215 [Mythimna separata]|uniref:N-acyl-aliphatic-L-amino acid amidohydrolase n=1 Tax=Mythimna separata TaxID=271217 RepID=A0AAD7YMZ5_MYTSE|nr:hypothetical protein PYW07_002215 [Mythimna separata]